MKRRSFGKIAALGIGAGMVSCVVKAPLTENNQGPIKRVKPSRLKTGDTIGLIAPASPFTEKVYDRANKHLKDMGFMVREGKNLAKNYGYLAGKDSDRISDLHDMFLDKEVKGIWCIRGGYGTSRILPQLDYELIRKNPKVLIGYSDITALLQAIYVKTGLIGFHGPVAASEMTTYTLDHAMEILKEDKKYYTIKLAPKEEEVNVKTEVISPGKAEGILLGGNLSLLAAIAGTEFQLDATDRLVFLEDVGEKPYRIDRMLTQLLQTANLDKANGIILGEFADCEAKEGDMSLSLIETLKDRLEPLNIPVFYGFSFGHIDNMCTLPVGIKASFDTESKILKLLEPAVK